MFASTVFRHISKTPMGLWRSIPSMMTGAVGSVYIVRHYIPKATPHNEKRNPPMVEPVITVPEYLQKLQETQQKRIHFIHNNVITELLAWKAVKTFSNPNVIYELSPELINELDYIRIMYDDRIQSPTTKELVYHKWVRCQEKTTSADQMAFMIHLSHYFRLHEI